MTTPPETIRLAACALLTVLAVTACQSVATSGASREEKTAALSRHLAAWERETLVNQFAQPRTVQVFSDLILDAQSSRIDASSTGQASLLTRDGYALTAAHVLDEGEAATLGLQEARRGLLTLTSAGPLFFSERHPEQAVRVEVGLLQAQPVRLVHRFPSADLALVKLALNSSRTFSVASAPPEVGAVLFTYGSNLSGNSSAGEALQISTFENRRPPGTRWNLITSIPLQKGDSGGPVMDARGNLVGIVSRGRTDFLRKRITDTLAVGISPQVLRDLIDADRAGS